MKYFLNIYGLFIILGLLAMFLVATIYRKRKNSVSFLEGEVMSNKDKKYLPVFKGEFTEKNLIAHLEEVKNNEPMFVSQVRDIVRRIETASQMKVLKQAIEHLNLRKEYLEKMNEYQDIIEVLEGRDKRKEKREVIEDLKVDVETARLNALKAEYNTQKIKAEAEAEKTKNPPPTKSRAEIEAEKRNKMEAEAERREKQVNEWRKELKADPDFDDEDIPKEVERRKRARGWIENV